MCKPTTLLQKTKTRRSPHTRAILAQLGQSGRVYLVTRDHGLIRITKKEARMLVRVDGDTLESKYCVRDLMLSARQ